MPRAKYSSNISARPDVHKKYPDIFPRTSFRPRTRVRRRVTQHSLVEVHKNFTSTYVNENSPPYIYIWRRNSHEQMFLQSGYERNSRRPALQPRKPIHSFSPQRSKELQSPTVVFLGSHPPSSCAGVFGGLHTSILICVNPPQIPCFDLSLRRVYTPIRLTRSHYQPRCTSFDPVQSR